ncbi:sodium:calcium antiporter [Rhodoferax sp.]|uniref:sodium:calcium antiporter n=1 Tax=Rhodoferax sp. TaxID=50421 RepID=UPI00276903F4|nr:sodium:calcium antiporter [Rhodoferax sp.]
MTPPFAATDLLFLLAAVPAAALGGSLFLKGVLGVAAWLRLPKMLVATTLAAFATSAPELVVSSMAALAGKPGIGLGNALGANVVNAGLIMGLVLLFGALRVPPDAFRRDFAFALGVPVLTMVLVLDGVVSRGDGVTLLVVFGLWMVLVVRQAVSHRREVPAQTGPPVDPVRAWLHVLVGVAGLVLAGHLFVVGASGIAVTLGVSAYVIGATIVALGTTMPELVTVVASRLRGHDDVGLGTLLGSNLFNGLAIVGLAASIHPIPAPVSEVAVALAFGFLTVLLMLPRDGGLSRRRGLALVGAYAGFAMLTMASPL